jgi:HAE1 family hydrophobic/amphiphilic exporter-1
MELFPDIEFPMTTVITAYPQAQPDVVLEEVTVPIESVADDIGQLQRVNSNTSEGISVVFFEFEFGTDMDQINETIDANLKELDLPEAVRGLPAMMPGLDENPRLFPININLMPVVTLSLNGSIPVEELNQIAIDVVVPRLKEIDGVFEVTTAGGGGDKVLVRPSAQELSQFGVSTGQLAAALAAQQFGSLDDIENAIVREDGLRLTEVADVSLGLATGTSLSRTNGRPSVSITVTKTAAANTVTTANAVVDEAKALKQNLRSGLDLVVVSDTSEYIEASVSDLTRNAIIGSLLAILIVFIFLAALRASLITAVSIPLSLLIGFLVMRFTNITINILTLSAMIIAVGRVIDNSIVILEVVFRRLQRGEAFAPATINGVREVVVPITSATVATVVIFAPLAFVGGIMGEMFLPFGLTITFALVGSLLIALTVIPALSGYLLGAGSLKEPRSLWYLKAYTRALRWCLHHRAVTLVVAIVLFLGSFAMMPIIGTTFIPQMDTNLLSVGIELPEGTDIDTTREVLVKVEDVIRRNAAVITYHSVAGSSGGSGGGMSQLTGGATKGNYASVSVVAEPDSDIEQLSLELTRDLSNIAPDGEINVAPLQALTGGMSSGLEVFVRGDRYEDVVVAANQLITELRNPDMSSGDSGNGGFSGRIRATQQAVLSSLSDIDLELADIEPRLIIEPDIQKMAAAGLSPENLQQIRQEFFVMMQGTTVARANLDGVTRDVFLEGIAGSLTGLEMARGLPVGLSPLVRLGDIATVELSDQLASISQIDGRLSATVTAATTEQNVGAVSQAVQARIDSLDLPPGVEIGMGGITEDMRDSFSAMFLAIGIAVVLAYAVLVLTFRSFRNPLIIMVSLPLASIGALLGLLVTGRPVGISALMGILMLVGIVLTNAVVLIAVVEQMRKSGMSPLEALVEGGRTRLRPILMTALTTMFAMLPLAFGLGQGVLMAAELATVVIGGLLSSTLLTLLVIPVVYAVTNRVRNEADTTREPPSTS